MPRRTQPLLLAAALALTAAPLAAQVIRFPSRRAPTTWLSLSGGVLQLGNVLQTTEPSSEWRLQTTGLLRASVEYERRGGTSFGVAATYARPVVRYTRITASGGVARSEPARETVSSLAALVRVGGGAGLHQVIEVGVGARRYAGFEARTDAGAAGTVDGAVALTGSLGFGVGYPLGQRAALSLVQDAEFTYFPGDAGAAPVSYDRGVHRTYVTRIGVRVGFGNRSRIR